MVETRLKITTKSHTVYCPHKITFKKMMFHWWAELRYGELPVTTLISTNNIESIEVAAEDDKELKCSCEKCSLREHKVKV